MCMNFYKLTLVMWHGIIKSMKKIISCLLVLCGLTGGADAYVNRQNAVMRVMNKDAGKVTEINIPVGSEVQFEKLYINIRTCQQSDPFQAEDFFAFVEITELNKGQIFGNWMQRNEPAKNPLQHPDYDVWLVRCE